MTATSLPQPTMSITDLGHVHARTCYWDCREARWECGSETGAATERPARAAHDRATPAPATR
jgi:hypothetical protein